MIIPKINTNKTQKYKEFIDLPLENNDNTPPSNGPTIMTQNAPLHAYAKPTRQPMQKP